MKGTRNLSVLIILGLVLILGVWGCSGYNGMIKKRNGVDNAWAQVDNQYQRRADLIDNLVNTVKGQVKAENQTLVQVIEARNVARNGIAGFGNLKGDNLTQDKINQFQKAFSDYQQQNRIFVNVVAEQYPELKSSQAFSELRTEIAGTENRLAVARKDFNDAVTSFKNSTQTFPNNLLASMFSIQAKDLLLVSPEVKNKPDVPDNFLK